MKGRRAAALGVVFAAEVGWTVALRLTNEDQAAPDLSRALECLRLTTPSLELEYPSDAEEHVEEIREALPWRPTPEPSLWRPKPKKGFSYHVEDMWMTEIMGLWDNRTNGTRLADIFGPYVPIFAYFVQPLVENSMWYPEAMLAALRKVLRSNVPYVVVSQSDEGLAGKGELDMRQYPNILVLSAGGYGNVAVPLWSANGATKQAARNKGFALFLSQPLRQSASLRHSFVSFVGTLGHSPWHLRERMKEVVENYSVAHNLTNRTVFYKGDLWRRVMRDSKFSLVPRGFGRSTYHLVETIHAGLIPIHIYSDIPWVPYPEIFNKFGFATNLTGLPALLDRLALMSPREIDDREAVVVQYAWSHFTPKTVIRQILNFVSGRNGGGDLRCQQLPATTRDSDGPSESDVKNYLAKIRKRNASRTGLRNDQ